jgi:hypothetical protein
MHELYKPLPVDEPRKFVRAAQRFLSATRCGYDEQAAVKRAKTTSAEVRLWLRDPKFAEAFQRAREGIGGARVHTFAPEDGDPSFDAAGWLADRGIERDWMGRVQ